MIYTINPFNVLWLSVIADDKLISKRKKEISQYLNMDEVPSFDNDIQGINYELFRNQELVNESYTQLTHQTKKIKSIFNWFIPSENSETALDYLSKWLIKKAYSSLSNSEDLFDIKNLLLLELIVLENKNLSRKSIDLDYDTHRYMFEGLLSNEKFWNQFRTLYSNHNEINLKSWELSSFKKEIKQIYAEDIFDLAENINDSKLYVSFVDTFWVQAKELDDNKNVTSILNEIDNIVTSIKDMDADDFELDESIVLIEKLLNNTKQLKDIWLDKNVKYRKMVDELARHVKWLSLELHRNWDDENAYILLLEVMDLDISDNLRRNLQTNLETLRENLRYNWIRIPVKRSSPLDDIQFTWDRESRYVDDSERNHSHDANDWEQWNNEKSIFSSIWFKMLVWVFLILRFLHYIWSNYWDSDNNDDAFATTFEDCQARKPVNSICMTLWGRNDYFIYECEAWYENQNDKCTKQVEPNIPNADRNPWKDTILKAIPEIRNSSFSDMYEKYWNELVFEIQYLLKNKWHLNGSIDGLYWPQTISAIKDFQKDNWLEQDWVPWYVTLNALVGNKIKKSEPITVYSTKQILNKVNVRNEAWLSWTKVITTFLPPKTLEIISEKVILKGQYPWVKIRSGSTVWWVDYNVAFVKEHIAEFSRVTKININLRGEPSINSELMKEIIAWTSVEVISMETINWINRHFIRHNYDLWYVHQIAFEEVEEEKPINNFNNFYQDYEPINSRVVDENPYYDQLHIVEPKKSAQEIGQERCNKHYPWTVYRASDNTCNCANRVDRRINRSCKKVEDDLAPLLQDLFNQ